MEKTFTVAGTSNLGGRFNVRCTNESIERRTLVLQYYEHTDIQLVELPRAMSKLEAAQHLQALPEFANSDAADAIARFIERNTPKASTGKRGRPLKLPTLADVPARENGRFIKREVREQMLADMIAERVAQHEAKLARIAERKAAKDAAVAA
jgi:hypothetical protein